MRREKLRKLAALLPLVTMLSHGLPSRAFGLEINASNVASLIAEALAQGNLAAAQTAVQQLWECNVRALSIDGVEYTTSRITDIISALARGETVDLVPRPLSVATFLIDPSDRVDAFCAIPEVKEAQQVFPTGSQGTETPPPG